MRSRSRRSPASLVPLLVGGGAIVLTAFGLLALRNDLSVSSLRARDRARETLRLTAAGVASELDALAAQLAAATADPADGASLEGFAHARPFVVLAFALDASGAVRSPRPFSPPAADPPPIEERVRVETFLDEAAFRETSLNDAASAAQALDRARDEAKDPRLRAQVELAQASLALRQGRLDDVRKHVAPLFEGDALLTVRGGLPARALAKLLVVRQKSTANDRDGAREAALSLRADLDGVARGAALALVDELAGSGALDDAEISAARARVESASRRAALRARLESSGADLLAAASRLPLGDALAVLAPREPGGRAGVLLDPAAFLADALPRADAIARAESIPVAAATRAGELDDDVEVPATGGLLRVGLPRGWVPSEPNARSRTFALGALLVLLGATIAGGAALMARASRREIEAAQAKSDFLAGVTHELKTPLTSIRLYSELLEEGRAPDETKRADYVRTIRGEAVRLTALIDRVLSLARRERGAPAAAREPVLAGDLVHGAATTFLPVAEHADVTLEITATEENTALTVDPAGVVQALLDLLDNAAKYSTPPATVELHGRRDGARYVIDVSDRGPGLSPAELDRVFGMFERGGAPDSREKPGLGIGLALARRIIEANGGSLSARARDGGGSVFTIALPIAEDAPA